MKASDEFLNIDTPENVGFDYEIAGIGSRFIAALIDSTIIVVALVVVNIVFSSLASAFRTASTVEAWYFAVAGILSFALIWGYYIYFEMRWNGQSPGKRKIGIRVLRHDGTPIAFTESAIRNLVRVVDFLPFAYGIGVVSMFINQQACRLGDLSAGTLVVHDREAIALTSLRQTPTSTMMTPFEASVRAWPLDRLNNDDLRVAQNLLQRRYELVNAPALARPILARLIAKIGVEDETYRQYDVLFVISTIVRAYSER